MSHKIAFREHGSGPLLVLLHGYGGSVAQWEGVVERLKDSYRVVVPNLSHLYMSSNRLLFPMIIELVADFITTQFPGEKVHLAGMSFGGSVAWGLALKRPDLVDKMILLNPMVPFPITNFRLPETKYLFVLPMTEKAILRVFETPIGQDFLKKAAEIFRPDRDSAERSLGRLTGRKLAFVANIVSHFGWILRSEDWKYWQDQLSSNKVPALVIWAQDDLLFNERSYRQFAFEIHATKAFAWSQGGHILSQSKPDEVAIVISEFLRLADQIAA